MVTQELITALTLGLIGGLIPGPVITAIFTEILQSGLKRAMRIIFIALLIESIVAVISLVIFSSLGLNESVFRILSFIGAGVLIWISFSLWKVKSLDSGEKVVFGIWKIILMILSNGVLWTYWITICIPKAIFVSETIRLGDYLFMGLVQTGWLISTLIVTIIFSRFQGLLSKPKVIPVVFKVFSLIFIYFALDMSFRSFIYFIS
ncbi:MAG: hypothetical protein PF450_01300 [Bacteroidales bacterium]|jgi:threonine/homoserine/homoserine lactone efflux protein|nr:hypothetical protein [Bacteroidales bacterium]